MEINKVLNEKTHMVMSKEANKFVKCIDEKKFRKVDIQLKKQQLLLGIYKYRFFIIKKRQVIELLQEYKKSLSKELEWLNTQKTKKNGDKYILDYKKIYIYKEFIKSEEESYMKAINSKFDWIKKTGNKIKENGIIIILIMVIGIITPIIIGIVVSTQSTMWLETDNDWIGFFGSYIGGIVGAIIGGVVAYKVAQYGFKSQRELDKESKVIELKISNLTNFISEIVPLQQNTLLYYEYIVLTFNHLYNEKFYKKTDLDKVFIGIPTTLELIRTKRDEINDILDRCQKEYEISRFLIRKFQDEIDRTLNEEVNILNQSESFIGFFSSCDKKDNTDTINWGGLKKKMNGFNNKYKELDYSLYKIIASLRNEISLQINLPIGYIQDHDEYMMQRFV